MKRWKLSAVRWVAASAMVLSVALFAGCEKDDDDDNNNQPSLPQTADFNDDAANAWIQTSRLMVKTSGITPPVAARAYGYLGQTMYEGVRSGMPNYISLAGQIHGMPPVPDADANLEYHWPSVVNKGSYDILAFLFAGSATALAQADSQFNALHDAYAQTVDAQVLERSENYGHLVATVIEVCAEQDGYATNHNCSYDWQAHYTEGAGNWEPTPPAMNPNPVEPCWGEMRPFVLDDAGVDCYPAAPPTYSTDTNSQFYIETLEVYETAGPDSTPEEQTIARFWADGGGTPTPPGHWLNITNIVLDAQNADLADAVEIYCKVGVAVNDAFISCWRAKFEMNYLRPVTAIRDLIPGAESWLPPIATPPFPECTSGHSTQSGAAYKVLEDFFGDVSFTDNTWSPARSFSPSGGRSAFGNAAWEAAYSRLYGGIHFRTACESGVTQGECIGEQVKALQFRANS